ncbi:hypothetical protein BK764_00305 [Bacillus thuringiensis serovar israelensis]|uniref:Phage gp6-like head-tail connector protein n=2 Tax=Bacillus thuringiensis TaxID=1428 RepID=A0A9Q5SL60_BACTU|nr:MULTISPECIES: hypothetical protein [Bacillus cereus group]EEM58651.1 hypothetical protein bthur0007_34540 [Bacillus thuringiensis serovar monterrey BGSC 4AJ1]MEB9670955.1 hypothetical protein [Bacillus anthracis]OTW45012.1 hypothetical protein BK699_28125 [Bacillus thuringiensis serovar mexicanensis]OTW73634.1 hypothetical protein BK707_02130 [Bacillus thuringiensis serovar coreanensis]OTX01643.1 hypothetical protein BK705_18685 [Bacillus thuringiensis serovar monterrey]
MDMKAEILKRVQSKLPNISPESLLIDIEDTMFMVAEYTNRTIPEFPPAYPGIIAKMVVHQYQEQEREGKKSESLGNYSVAYDDVGDYPASITKGLKVRLRVL